MNGDQHSTDSSRKQQFLLTAVRLCTERGFVTNDRIVSYFKPLNVLRLLTKKERAEILQLTGLHGDAPLALAGMDSTVWWPIVMTSDVKPEAIANSVGLDRLVEVLDSSVLWTLSTEKSFWRMPKEDDGYKAAHDCVVGIIEEGLRLNLLTPKTALRGEIAQALIVHLTGDEKATLANRILSEAGNGALPSYASLWTDCLPLHKLPLPLIWENLVIDMLAAPLGLTTVGTGGPESLSAEPEAQASPADLPVEVTSVEVAVAVPAVEPEPKPAAPPAAPAEDTREAAPGEAPAPPFTVGDEAADRIDAISTPPPVPSHSAEVGSEPPAPVPTIMGIGTAGTPVGDPETEENASTSPHTRREGSGAPPATAEGESGPKARRTRSSH